VARDGGGERSVRGRPVHRRGLVRQRWEDRGYIAYLATARDWRGRGLGRALLASSLAKIHAAGFEHAVLVVNDRNESATRLYESVGMKIASRSERWDKRLA
jgi:ribosomal protein S18 acetylase RimI-like enzyme